MPRLPRLHVAGGYYHVMLRGNHREDLFATSSDRYKLNDIVGEVLARFDARAHAFCWMTNPIHLLVQVAEQPLSKIMHRIAMRYSRYRHRLLGTTGHLFERRYRAKLVEMDAYAFALLRYIHRNPVVAGIVTHPGDYPWSSHRAYLGHESISWLTVDVGLGLFGTTVLQSRTAYARWMAEASYASEQRLWDETHPDDARVLGGDKFLANLSPPTVTPRSSITLLQLAEQLCTEHRVALQEVRSATRHRYLTAARVAITRQALNGRVATLPAIGRFLGRNPSTLSELLTRHSPNPIIRHPVP